MSTDSHLKADPSKPARRQIDATFAGMTLVSFAFTATRADLMALSNILRLGTFPPEIELVIHDLD